MRNLCLQRPFADNNPITPGLDLCADFLPDGHLPDLPRPAALRHGQRGGRAHRLSLHQGNLWPGEQYMLRQTFPMQNVPYVVRTRTIQSESHSIAKATVPHLPYYFCLYIFFVQSHLDGEIMTLHQDNKEILTSISNFCVCFGLFLPTLMGTFIRKV